MSTKARLNQVTVDLLTCENSIAATVLQLVPLDRVRVSNLPEQFISATQLDGFAEGWSLALSDQTYAVTLDLSPVI
jgi:hypothetical protein